ncbi:hypothetical protein [Inquilinus sp.]|jgi:multidrug efflux pump subunit AcrA (membrane-fusion protein)|uniref:hypothetical protein n=1 Tax=Inquilinus sp. TaxID=1932117 RepID=UPI003784936E
MGVLDTQDLQLRADAKAKNTAHELDRTNLGYTRITAPVDGMVGERGVRAGQDLRPGTQVNGDGPDSPDLRWRTSAASRKRQQFSSLTPRASPRHTAAA